MLVYLFIHAMNLRVVSEPAIVLIEPQSLEVHYILNDLGQLGDFILDKVDLIQEDLILNLHRYYQFSVIFIIIFSDYLAALQHLSL